MKTDLEKIIDLIKKEIPFSLIRFGDGEKNILDNIPCKRKGFEFNSEHPMNKLFRSELQESLEYKSKNYFVGTNHPDLKKQVKSQNISASLFVNANYLVFLEKMIPILRKREAILICHIDGKIHKLPFELEKKYTLYNQAWLHEDCIEDYILNYLSLKKKQRIVLVAGGPFSNVLIHRLWKINKRHIFLDVGSVFDTFLFGKNTRKYHERLNNVS